MVFKELTCVTSLRNGNLTEQFNGTLSTPATYVSVSWPWLTLPIFLVFLTFFFLLVTMLQNRGGGYEVWKSSPLAPLQALSAETRDDLGGLKSNSDAERRAEEIKVCLRKESGRWVLG